MLDQTLQQMLPKLTTRARQELNQCLTELWGYTPQVVRYRKGKRLVLGFYWLKSGCLRCLSIRPDQVRVERWDLETDKLYYHPRVWSGEDQLSTLQEVRWDWFHEVSVSEWLARTVSSTAPAIQYWDTICKCSGYVDPEIIKHIPWDNINYYVIGSWIEDGLQRHLAVHLDQNKLVCSILTEYPDWSITPSKLSTGGVFPVIKLHALRES